MHNGFGTDSNRIQLAQSPFSSAFDIKLHLVYVLSSIMLGDLLMHDYKSTSSVTNVGLEVTSSRR